VAFDAALADRVGEVLADQPGLSARKLFGAYGFFLDGHLCCGVHGDRLLIRTSPEHYQALLARPEISRFPEEGRVMNNWLSVDPEAFAEDEDLLRWIEEGIAIARSLPPK
jgi:TfoX/Sxy family transcriptional regulator of competence genes